MVKEEISKRTQNQLKDFVEDNSDLKIKNPMNDAENKNDRPNF